MEQPRRRVRRQQQEQPELQQTESAEPPTENSAPPRRRRIQQAQTEEPQKTNAHSDAGEQKAKRSRTDGNARRIKQMLLGAAALMAMTGAAAVRAAKRIWAAFSRRCAQTSAGAGMRRTERSAKTWSSMEFLRLAAMALCACVAVVSAWQVGSIVLRSVRTNRLNESLSQQRAAAMEAQRENEQGTIEAITIFAPTAEPQPEAEPQLAAEPQPVIESQSAPAAEAVAAPDVVKTTKYRQVGGDALPEMAQLHGQNHDLVAWIQIPDVLDLPVVYRDNSYYLTRDFTKQKNASGTIFLDENHPFREKTQNLLLHGHNMKDGTMFGRLAQYLYDDTYLRNHPIIYFDTLWHKEQYVICAVLDVSLEPGDERFFNYFTHDTFSSDAEFVMYIRQLQLRSRYAIPIDVEPSDALLTLSTCLDDDRLVIVARRLREGETRSELRTLIRMATRQ